MKKCKKRWDKFCDLCEDYPVIPVFGPIFLIALIAGIEWAIIFCFFI